jgi:hypothetical protein
LQKHATAEYVKERIEKRHKELAGKLSGQVSERIKRLESLENKIANLIAYLADGNVSPTVSATIKELESEASRERSAIQWAQAAQLPIPIPPVDEVMAELQNLKNLVASDPLAGREALRAYIHNGRLTVKLDVSTKQITVKGGLIPAGLKTLIFSNINGENAVSTHHSRCLVSSSGSGGDDWVLEKPQRIVPIEVLMGAQSWFAAA